MVVVGRRMISYREAMSWLRWDLRGEGKLSRTRMIHGGSTGVAWHLHYDRRGP